MADVEKFILTSLTLQKLVDLDTLDEKKRFRLKKRVTAIRKQLKAGKAKSSKEMN